MWRLAVGVIGLAACGRIGFDPAGDSQGSFPVRSTLTLDRAAIPEALVDFPIAIVLDDTRARRDLMSPDGSDLRFRDSSGTLLAHEIEQLGVPGGAPLVAWVLVPRIDGTSTTITVEYGDSPPPPSMLPVWNDSYLGVWHMQGTGTLIDATPNHLDGSVSGTTAATGVVGGARSFDASNPDSVVVPGGASLGFPQMTLSGWMNPRAAPGGPTGYFGAITRELGLTPQDDFYLGTIGLQVNTGVTSTNDGAPYFIGPEIGIARWTHVAFTYDGTTVRTFIDGVERGAQPGTGVPVASAGPIFIGCGRNENIDNTPLNMPDVDFMDGMLDEIRLEQVGRSPAWIATEVASMRDELISYGPVEPR